jgi:RHS repeat-associated protein
METRPRTCDHLNRLASGTPTSGVYSGQNQQLCLDYDSFGNRTQSDLQTTACKPGTDPATANYSANNQLHTTAAGVFSYDAAGDVLNDGATQYLYDAEGRVCASANTPAPGYTTMTGYIYDADGLRVAKGTITRWSCDPGVSGFATVSDYVLGPGGEQVAEYGAGPASGSAPGAMAWQHSNVWAAGKLVATYDKDGLHFYLDDPLGSRRVQTDFAGATEQTCASLPFGDALACTGSNQFPTEHHFTGKERDTESGLDYFGARYYASNMGRFLSPDWSASPLDIPYADLTNPQSLNLYSYVNNNPLSKVDKDGHEVDLTGTDKDKKEELARLAANASKTDKNGVKESSLFKETTDKNGKTTLTLDKDAAANFKGEHSAGYNLLTGAIDAKPTISVGLSDKDSFTSRPDAQGNVTVNLNRNVSPIDMISPLRGFDEQVIPNPFSIIAGHETLGHAYPRIMGWPSDEQSARQVENQLRREQGLPLRNPNSN